MVEALPPADEVLPGDPFADDEGGEGEPLENEAPALGAKRRQGKGRNSMVADRSCFQPVDCTLRKYNSDGDSCSWLGILPKGRLDDQSRHSRRLTWGFFVGRSEAEAVQIIEDWLLRWGVPVPS